MFNVANMSFNAIREKKFSRKSPNLQYCFIFYEIMEPQFCLNSSLMPHSLASGSHSRFCVNDYIAKMNTKIAACSNRRMAENGFAPPPREFCRHILSCRELKAESFKRCLHSVLRGVSL